MDEVHEQLDKIHNPQVVRLIRTFVYRGSPGTHERREVVRYHGLDGSFAGEYDPAICRVCLEQEGQIVLFCTSDHK